ncbi:MAG: ATP-binding protein [Elusimicrobia bacterium]|nr:ATP-binding protein [Elusimicrobiota bacterium]
MIPRFIKNQIEAAIKPGIVVGLFGARRTGKTVLMDQIASSINGRLLKVQGEDLNVAEILGSRRLSELKKFVAGYDHLFIDEAQKIGNIGVGLKLLADTVPEISIFATGSSAFGLREEIGEPLVGRSRYFHLYPIAELEWKGREDMLKNKENLEARLVYGSYPQVATAASNAEKKVQLEGLENGYLLKDILERDNIKDSLFILNLLRQIAFQIGKDISYNELAANLNANRRTVVRYLELLEKTFVIFSLPGFSKNLRSEYNRTPRYYFWDNGVRNIVISNLNPLNSRDDIGALWENYCVSERLKKKSYQSIAAGSFFWRTYEQKEIDYLEEREGKLFGYEFKWRDSSAKMPKKFSDAYPDSGFNVVNRDNYLDFAA